MFIPNYIKSYVYCIEYVEQLGNRFTKVKRLSSELKLSVCELLEL